MRAFAAAALLLTAAYAVHGAQLRDHAPGPQRDGGEIEALIKSWAGVHDSAEQIIFDEQHSALASDSTQRIRTIIAPVSIPWLGAHVLYLEESLHEAPGTPRRQLLLRLSIDAQLRSQRIRVQLFTFRQPGRWRGLFSDREELQALHRDDIETLPGCDLLLVREGDQFRGGTLGRGCVTPPNDPQRYVDYSLLVGDGQYWYRTRQFRFQDDALVTEAAGYDWPALHRARLFTCSVRWSASGRQADLAPLMQVDLPDRAGRADVTLPDGREFELSLHGGDWPFDPNHDALVLDVHQNGGDGAGVSSWAGADATRISVELEAMDVRCGPLTPARINRS